jgi:protein-S-isoprenylcysteine O-methyltransferase Ste14
MTQPLPIMVGYALWFMFVIAWNATGKPLPTVAAPAAARERLYGLVISLGLIMIVTAPFLLIRQAFQLWINPPLLAWGMLLIVAAGIAFCWWARLHLGRFWSAAITRKQGHRVVDSGPYRLVRHPIYAGFIVMDLGLALLCGSALALVGVAAITVGLWLKARVEEDFLAEELGAAAYGAYKARTPMLMPRMARRPEALRRR